VTRDRIGPSHRKVADDLRAKITSGLYPVGGPIPSTVKLAEEHSVSVQVIRRAVTSLMEEGVLVGQPGKAVYVKATPAALAEEQVTIEGLGDQMEALRAEFRGLADRLGDRGTDAELVAEVASLRSQVGALQAHLLDLYTRMGYPYPEDLGDQADQREQRGTGS
jgi:DNA-binding transcriptional regulator YhcF (GntR family)